MTISDELIIQTSILQYKSTLTRPRETRYMRLSTAKPEDQYGIWNRLSEAALLGLGVRAPRTLATRTGHARRKLSWY